jgi:hypothetical protein
MLAKNAEGGRIVIKIDNYRAIIISDEPMNDEIRKYTNVENSFADIIERNGHIFYVITFPSADKTWAIDITDPHNSWHQWSSIFNNEPPSELPTRQGRFRGNCHASINGNNIFGDCITGKLFFFSESINKDYDQQLWRERTCQHQSDKNLFIGINWLQIDVEAATGVLGIDTTDNPLLMLTVSRDGGKTWGNEMPLSIGTTGKYKNRCKKDALGTARVFTFRIRSTDPVYNVIFGAIADVEEFE